jgi:outer membrane protein assembly factor BamB
MRRNMLLVLVLATAALTAASVHAAARSLAVGATVSVPSQFRTLGVAAGDGAVWATDGTATLTRVDPASQSVVASIPVRDADLVAVAASTIWVVGSNSIAYRIDPHANKVASKVRVAQDPTGIALGDGALWVAGRSGRTITRVNATTGRLIAKVTVPESPRYVAVGAGAVWAASNDSPTIWRINPAKNKVVASIALTDTPNGIAATANGVWVLGATNNRVIRINPHTNKIAGFTAIPKNDGVIGYGGAITADATSVWVATLTQLLQLDPRTGHVLASAAVGTHPSHDPVGLTALSSGPAGLWVGDADGKAIDQITH